MRKVILSVPVLAVLLAAAGCATYATPAPPPSSVVVEPAPVIVEPELVYIPDYDVYVIARPGISIFYYGGFYYRLYRGHWERSEHFEGGHWGEFRGRVPFRTPPHESINHWVEQGPRIRPNEIPPGRGGSPRGRGGERRDHERD